MMPAIPHMQRSSSGSRSARASSSLAFAGEAGLLGACSGYSDTLLGQIVEVSLDVPVSDGRHELLPLIALVVHEDAVHVPGERALDHLVALQRIQGVPERH